MTAPGSEPVAPGAVRPLDLVAVLVVASVLAGLHLGHSALRDPDEPRSALIARLMLEGPDWVVPHLPAAVESHDPPEAPVEYEGLLVYFDKPPLFFWLEALAMKALGPTALAARLPAAAAFVGATLLVYVAGALLAGRVAGLFAAAALALSPMLLVLAHAARLDGLLIALMTLVLVALVRLLSNTPRPLVWTWVLYGGAALAMLTKGLEALIIPAAAVGLTAIVTGRWSIVRQLHPLRGLVIFLAVAAPWFAYMHFRYPGDADQPGYLYTFFVRHHFERATTAELGHTEFPGYSAVAMLLGFLPWTLLLPGVCATLARPCWRERRERPVTMLLFMWVVAVLALFSFSKTQLAHYTGPALPALALLAGVYVERNVRSGSRSKLYLALLGATLLAAAAALVALTIRLEVIGLWRTPYLGFAAVAAALLVAGAVTLFMPRRRALTLIFTAAAMAVIAAFVITAERPEIYDWYSARTEAMLIGEKTKPGDPVIAHPVVPYSLAWYLWPREVTAVKDLDAAAKLLNRRTAACCYLRRAANLQTLRDKVQNPLKVLIARRGHVVVVSEPPKKEGPKDGR